MVKKLTLKYKGEKIWITPVINVKTNDQDFKKRTITQSSRSDINISVPEFSGERVTHNLPVTCKVTISGKNIAQISSEVMLNIHNTLIGPVFRNFLFSPEERELNGTRQPRWLSENEIEFEIKPMLRLLYCGTGFSLAFMEPEQYGVELEMQIWSLEGIYQRGGGEPFRVRLEFDNQGSLIRKTGFYPSSTEGEVSPFELFIEDGDTFEPYVTLISPRGVETLATANPIMLGGGNLPHWVESEAMESIYQIGVLVEGFDGKIHRKYAPIKVEKQDQ